MIPDLTDYEHRLNQLNRLFESNEKSWKKISRANLIYYLTTMLLWKELAVEGHKKLEAELDATVQLSEAKNDRLNTLEAKNKRLNKGIDMAHLHLLASICECGEPLKESDAFDCLDALKEGEL